MIAAIKKTLNDMGYTVSEEAHKIIGVCDDWYKNRITSAHNRTTVNGTHYQMERMGFGRRAAADDANLCEIVQINAGGGNDAQSEAVNDILAGNRFDTQLRRQLELTAAEGTTACYIYLDDAQKYTDGSIRGGNIRLNYVDALGFMPLTIENGEVIEAAFTGRSYVKTEERHTLVICTREDGTYSYTVRVFDEYGEEIPEERQDVPLGDVKPFAVLRTALVNNLENMDGFGLPKLLDAIPILKGLDAGFTAFLGDLEAAEKITLINEMLCKFDDNGKPIPPNEEMKRRFVLLGEKLPQDKDLVHEINPEIRSEAFCEAIELLLNLLSQQFGYGTKRYSLDRSTGAIATATQYIGERQDMMQELNRQRHETKEYITGIVRAILWFANTYHAARWNIDADVLVDFDDSYITDKGAQLEAMYNDIVSGIGGAHLRALYLKQKYNLDDATAARWAQLPDPDANTEPED